MKDLGMFSSPVQGLSQCNGYTGFRSIDKVMAHIMKSKQAIQHVLMLM